MSFAVPSRRYSLKPPARSSGAKKFVLGIDPGSYFCGYGLLEIKGNDIGYAASGRIGLSKKDPLEVRLKELYGGLLEILAEFPPAAGVVEKIFFAKGVRAALSLGHARGVAIMALARAGVPVFEYSALEVKKAVTGYGRAEKAQMQFMVQRILGLGFPLSPDGADALALALCHMQKKRVA
jgi:crossover junction endodeoxyribonuclease RuvC